MHKCGPASMELWWVQARPSSLTFAQLCPLVKLTFKTLEAGAGADVFPPVILFTGNSHWNFKAPVFRTALKLFFVCTMQDIMSAFEGRLSEYVRPWSSFVWFITSHLTGFLPFSVVIQKQLLQTLLTVYFAAWHVTQSDSLEANLRPLEWALFRHNMQLQH